MQKFLFLIMGLIFFVNVEAQDLDRYLQSIRTMQADFSQVIYDNHNKAIQEARGKMALERPGKFRWEVMKPIPQLVIANQQKVWIYDPDLEQVTIKKLEANAGETPAILLSHQNNHLEKQFKIEHVSVSGGKSDQFTLSPKNKDSAFAAIVLEFSNDKLKTMKLKDHLGHTTKITFKNIHLNKAPQVSLFKFKPKSGIDIIDETKQ